MPDTVTLRFTGDLLKGRLLTFKRRTECLFGRGLDCAPRFPDQDAYQTISRRHCAITIDPPRVRIRDLGSLNGTWVNGRSIGRRHKDEPPGSSSSVGTEVHDLKDGDEIRIGEVVMTVAVSSSTTCTVCGAPIPEGSVKQEGPADEPPVCSRCRQQDDRTVVIASPDFKDSDPAATRPAKGTDHCQGCGQSLARGLGQEATSGFLCSSCQRDPYALVEALLGQAEKGFAELAPLKGMTMVRGLGRGATGAAFLLQKKETGEYAALKYLLPEAAVNEWVRKSFLREIRNTESLDHPNVVKLYESGSYENIFYFTMEFCDGGSLDKLQKEYGGQVPLTEATRLILQALDGLDYIHHAEIAGGRLGDDSQDRVRGLVHRDLKPANIFLSGSGRNRTAKIADVGVGKAFDTAGLSGLTRTGTVAGSPVAMPRQQVINFKYARPDVDVWAMAATYYIILTGHYPRHFPPGEDPFRVVLETQPVPIRERNASIPPALAEVIDKALVDNPVITFQSAAELKQALERAV